MKNLVYIFIGGGLGSVLRFAVSTYSQKFYTFKSFPIGTFAVNMLGCLLMGVLISLLARADSSVKYLLITGFCGGFTTFSAFSAENVSLWQNGNYFILLSYILLSVFIGIAAVYAGMQIVKL